MRAVIGTMSIESLIQNRDELINKVKGEAAEELSKIGVGIDILNIQSITDGSNYIDAMGKKRTAEVTRDAAIGKAEAERDSKIRSSAATKDGMVAESQNNALTAEAEKLRDVKKAQYQAEVAAENAKAAQAGPLAHAMAEQQVVVEQTKIEEERSRSEIAVQTQKALVAEKEQEATVVVPAKKKAEAGVAQAKGLADAKIEAARGEAESTAKTAEGEKRRLEFEGQGEAAKIKALAIADAERVTLLGQAEASAIQAKLEAEAIGILKKAEAYKQMDSAAQFQMILEKLPTILEKIPEIVAAAAAPMSAIDKVVIIDSGDGQGVQKFANNAPAFLLKLVETGKQMGIDLAPMLGKAGISMTDVTVSSAADDDVKK